MLVFLSPSKRLNFTSEINHFNTKDPRFIDSTIELVKIMKQKKVKDLADLMGISTQLAQLNFERFQNWSYPYDKQKARPAILAFKGDVYEGLKAWELEKPQLEYAQKHVRILSGLHGLLEPMDLILPYRLEMGIKIEGTGFGNLYEYWHEKVTNQIIREIKSLNENFIVNLASDEYSRVIDFELLPVRVITPFFKEYRNGQYKFITFSGKKARGLMTRYIIDRQINDIENLKLFDYEGYNYHEQESNNDRWVFTR